jgi:hypothetical protein
VILRRCCGAAAALLLSSSGTRLMNEFRLLLYRRGAVWGILAWLAGPAVRGGECAVFLGSVVTDRLSAHDRALMGHLY